jgi:hypothetical protein
MAAISRQRVTTSQNFFHVGYAKTQQAKIFSDQRKIQNPKPGIQDGEFVTYLSSQPAVFDVFIVIPNRFGTPEAHQIRHGVEVPAEEQHGRHDRVRFLPREWLALLHVVHPAQQVRVLCLQRLERHCAVSGINLKLGCRRVKSFGHGREVIEINVSGEFWKVLGLCRGIDTSSSRKYGCLLPRWIQRLIQKKQFPDTVGEPVTISNPHFSTGRNLDYKSILKHQFLSQIPWI